MGLRIKVSVNRKPAGNETAVPEEVYKLDFNTYTLYRKAFRLIRIRLKKQGIITRYSHLNDPRTLSAYIALRVCRYYLNNNN